MEGKGTHFSLQKADIKETRKVKDDYMKEILFYTQRIHGQLLSNDSVLGSRVSRTYRRTETRPVGRRSHPSRDPSEPARLHDPHPRHHVATQQNHRNRGAVATRPRPETRSILTKGGRQVQRSSWENTRRDPRLKRRVAWPCGVETAVGEGPPLPSRAQSTDQPPSPRAGPTGLRPLPSETTPVLSPEYANLWQRQTDSGDTQRGKPGVPL